jgi:hypothetical protein
VDPSGGDKAKEKRLFRVRYRPVGSIAGLPGNVLETIPAHWPPVMGDIH